MWGTLDLDTQFHGRRFSVALKNSLDNSIRLAMTLGYRVFCCDNGAFSGDFQPVLAKHSRSFNLIDPISIGRRPDAAQLRTDGPAGGQVARLAALRRIG